MGISGETVMYHLLWMFLIYSFIGWAVGTAAAAMRKKKFIDVGFLYGPWCPSYGLGGAAFAVLLPELKNSLFFWCPGSPDFFWRRFSIKNGGIIQERNFSLEAM